MREEALAAGAVAVVTLASGGIGQRRLKVGSSQLKGAKVMHRNDP
jgi:hypothetical protein